MTSRIARELKEHVPFTALGALTGIIFMVIVVLGNVPHHISETIFHTLHPAHVLLSALVTTAMYTRYKKGKIWAAILIGWTGSIGIATISDAIIPYLGGTLLHVQMERHVPFILLSTWASLFYIMAFGEASWIPLLPVIFLILFLAVWLPCCLSDIVYPLLFLGKEPELPSPESQNITS